MILAYFDDHRLFLYFKHIQIVSVPLSFHTNGDFMGRAFEQNAKTKQHVAANITRWRYLPTQRPLAPTEKCCTPLSAMVTSPFQCNILEGTINKAQVCATHPPIHRLTQQYLRTHFPKIDLVIRLGSAKNHFCVF